MIRIYRGGDLKMPVKAINGLADKFICRFYTTEVEVYASRTDEETIHDEDGNAYFAIGWDELKLMHTGIIQYRAATLTPDQSYGDGTYDFTLQGQTNYYLKESAEGDESIIVQLIDLRNDLNQEIEDRTESEIEINGRIDDLADTVAEITGDLSGFYTKSETDQAISTAVTTETTRAQQAEGEISTTVQSNYADCIQRINSEAQTRSTNDQAQVAAIDNLSGRIQSVEGQFELYYPKTQLYTKSEVDAKDMEIYTSIGSEESSRIAADNNLQSAINQKANSADVYAKTAVDTMLNAKADKSTTYTKAEVDAAINAHTPDLSNYYTKSETDTAISTAIGTIDLSSYETIANHNADVATINTAISAKANSADVYTKSETDQAIDDALAGIDLSDYYTKTEIDSNERVIASSLNDLNERIDAIPTVDLSDYYTKSETDTALSAKADTATTLAGYGITDAYTKTAVDTALSAKADASTTYSKTEVDTALSAKADSSSVYTKSEIDTALSGYETKTDHDADMALKADKSTTYTKTEVDTALNTKADQSSLSSYVTTSEYSADMQSFQHTIEDNEEVTARAFVEVAGKITALETAVGDIETLLANI